jgi:hypothetical protein
LYIKIVHFIPRTELRFVFKDLSTNVLVFKLFIVLCFNCNFQYVSALRSSSGYIKMLQIFSI